MSPQEGPSLFFSRHHPPQMSSEGEGGRERERECRFVGMYMREREKEKGIDVELRWLVFCVGE